MMMWLKEKKIKSLIDNPYVATALVIDAWHSVSLCQPERHPAHRLSGGTRHCMALSVPWSNVGKAAASQVPNRVFIVLRPEGEGEGEGQGSHTTSALLYFLVDVNLKGWGHLWVDGAKEDMGLYKVQILDLQKMQIYIYIYACI